MDKKTKTVTKQTAAMQKNLLAIIPSMQQEKTKKFTTLALTLFLLCVFGIFAISPTLSTIAELKKKIQDSTYVSQNLDTKIQNLSTLHTLYAQLSYKLPIIFSAIPQTPKTTYLVGQIQQLAQDSGITVQSIQVEQVDLTKQAINTGSFIFVLSGQGTKAQNDAFIQSLFGFDRILTLDTISYTQSENTNTSSYTLNVRAKAYFKQ